MVIFLPNIRTETVFIKIETNNREYKEGICEVYKKLNIPVVIS